MQETFNKYVVNERIMIVLFQQNCEDGLQWGLEWEKLGVGGCLITQVVKAARMDDGGGGKQEDSGRQIFRRGNQEAGWWVLSKK